MLSDVTSKLETVWHVRWSTTYDVKSDGFTLTDGSCIQFVEDLLNAVRAKMSRVRTLSTASSTSSISESEPVETSTPARKRLDLPVRTPSMEDDMRYFEAKYEDEEKCYISLKIHFYRRILSDDREGDDTMIQRLDVSNQCSMQSNENGNLTCK